VLVRAHASIERQLVPTDQFAAIPAEGANVKFGINVMCTDETIQPGELAVMAEDLGFESVFFPEHTHVPVVRQTPSAGGGPLPRDYHRVLDPISSMTAAAARTTEIRVGTAVCLAAQHDPIILAKQLASVDRASNGRLLFGVGAGWSLEEAANHGVNPNRRFGVLGEKVRAIKELWTQEEPEFHGQYVDFDPVYSYPKPLQSPHPPILVGGVGPSAPKRVLEYGDEWFPTRQKGQSFEELGSRIASLAEAAREQGMAVPRITAYRHEPRSDVLAELEKIGISRCVFSVSGHGDVQGTLVRIAQVIAPFSTS
jgi:probable F420-dependent oxidoreductase